MAQATAHKTINVEQMAQNVAYSILPDDQTSDKKCEETLQQLHTKADKAWKDTNDLVFNHQLCYDGQLAAFISNAERSLQEKWDKVWECVDRLTDVAGVSHNACLGLALQVLNKLPTIPIDLSYCMPIPMMMAYGPEPYACQTWHEDGGETSSLGKEARASCLLMRKLKWLSHEGRINDSSSDRSASWSTLPAQQHLALQGTHHQVPDPCPGALCCGIDEVHLDQALHPASTHR